MSFILLTAALELSSSHQSLLETAPDFTGHADPEDCGVFWNCQDGKGNRYECPPGLAFDQDAYQCLWASEVAECSSPIIPFDEEGGEFQCPSQGSVGTFSKHAHPADCRQYFLCINGIPREQGCPLGEVFNSRTGSGSDGQCTDPEGVPECSNYYAGSNDLELKRFEDRESSNPGRLRTGRKLEQDQDSYWMKSVQCNFTLFI